MRHSFRSGWSPNHFCISYSKFLLLFRRFLLSAKKSGVCIGNLREVNNCGALNGFFPHYSTQGCSRNVSGSGERISENFREASVLLVWFFFQLKHVKEFDTKDMGFLMRETSYFWKRLQGTQTLKTIYKEICPVFMPHLWILKEVSWQLPFSDPINVFGVC